jgi:hypothetical protein
MLDMALAQHPDFKQVFHILPNERSKRVQVGALHSPLRYARHPYPSALNCGSVSID